MRNYIFYVDDSGTRQPDKKSTAPSHGCDWFALGGVLIAEDNEDRARNSIDLLKEKWKIDYPLHSFEIRGRCRNFAWLKNPDLANEFLFDLQELLVTLDVVGLACVIDRPGYNRRYEEKYGRQRWSLCRTAFSIAVERAVRFAAARESRLRVYVEGSDKQSEGYLRQYYDDLKSNGMPFNKDTSSKYEPVDNQVISQRLFEFKVKQKSSPLMQVADLYLYPMCRGGYEPNYRPYRTLLENGKLIDSHLEPSLVDQHGIKYSCFEKTKA